MEAHKLLLVLRLVVQRRLYEVGAGHDAFGVLTFPPMANAARAFLYIVLRAWDGAAEG